MDGVVGLMEKIVESLKALDKESVDAKEEEDKILEPLLDLIEEIDDDIIREFVRAILVKAHDSFWTFSFAMTEEDYPPDELKEGGTVLHVRRAYVAGMFMARAQRLSHYETDMLRAALLLHDYCKFLPDEEDEEIRYNPYYPYTLGQFIENIMEVDKKDPGYSSTLNIDTETMSTILRLIRVQRGVYSPIPETIPASNVEWIMNFAVIVSSRVHHIVEG